MAISVALVALLVSRANSHSAPTAPSKATVIRVSTPHPTRTPDQPAPTTTNPSSARTTQTGSDSLPLAGKVVGIDPGHNGDNYTDPSHINHLVWNGREDEACDTTGTETDSGYTEARFNFNVARYLTADLHSEGAKVVLSRSTNTGIGPCITERARILNDAKSDVAIDIHADGGPPGGHGFAILEPVPDGPNDHVITSSRRFGRVVLERYRALTGLPESTYDGSDGIAPRDNLAGLNLTTVPKILIECANMRNATDAALLERGSFQRVAARAFAEAITQYLA
jgi:N-acetylmuramoyl-L-alanine amidase